VLRSVTNEDAQFIFGIVKLTDKKPDAITAKTYFSEELLQLLAGLTQQPRGSVQSFGARKKYGTC
jgi:hypothetical protein